MTTSHDIGPVPQRETLHSDPIKAALMTSVFRKQLQRARPLLAESGARYAIGHRIVDGQTQLTVRLQLPVSTWATASVALDLAAAAKEIDHWDATAVLELQRHGIAPADRVEHAALAA